MGTKITWTALKKNWAWIALAFTLLVTVIMGPDEEPVVHQKSKKQAATSAANNTPSTSPHLAILPSEWPERDVERNQIKDIFQPGTINSASKSQPSNAPALQPAPLPQDQFDHEVFGAISDGPIQTAFLLTPDKRVITVEVGNNINPLWKLVALDPNQATLLHLPTGKKFLMQLRSTS